MTDHEASRRKLFARQDLWLFAILLLLGAALFFLLAQSPKGTVAVVERNGETILRRELSALTGPEEVEIRGENNLSLTIVLSPEGGWVEKASCPDQVCVRTGKLTKAGETALCLPARVSVRLEGAGGADAETY